MKLGGKWFWGVFLTVLVVFNWRLVGELVDKSGIQYVSDGTITEFVVETAFIQLKSGQSMFARTYSALYPFGVNFAMNDPGVGVLPYYAIFRQFTDVHKSMILVIFTNLVLTGWLMNKFLRERNISELAAGLGAMVFTFTPFLSHRLLGHYTYTPLFVFPLCALLITKVLGGRASKRLWWAAGLGVAVAWTLYLNFYYFIMIGLSLGIIVVWKLRLEQIKYWVIAAVVATVCLIPWVKGTLNYLEFENRTQTEGFGGAIYYSAELKNFFLPSAYNPLYRAVFSKIGGAVERAFLHNWERMVYPGMLLIIIFAYYFLHRRKIPKIWRGRIDPWVRGAIIFGVLAMGPFVKWRGSIELLNLEGVGVVVPLPFLLLHYIPGLESLRVPGRFAPAMVFLAVVAGAYLLDYLLAKTQYKKTLVAVLVGIFCLDQCYQIPLSVTPPLPTPLYEQIRRDPVESTILEIPFTVRDGYRYAGFVHGIGPMQGTIIHQKPVIGGYLARVSDEVMEYYQNLKLAGYLLLVTDRGNYDPVFEEPADPKLYPYPYTVKESNEELDFLGIKYILIKQDEPYTELVTSVLEAAGIVEINSAQGYKLYERKLRMDPSKRIDFGSGVVAGNGYQAMVAQDTKLLFKGEVTSSGLEIELSSQTPRTIEWYINEKRGGKIEVAERAIYRLGQDGLKPGVNILFLKITNLIKGEALDEHSGVKIYNLKVGGE